MGQYWCAAPESGEWAAEWMAVGASLWVGMPKEEWKIREERSSNSEMEREKTFFAQQIRQATG